MSESNKKPVEGHFLLQLNQILSNHCDRGVVQDHQKYTAKHGPDHPTTKALAAQVAEGGKAAVAEMIDLINDTAKLGKLMLPMTADDFMAEAVEESMSNEKLKELRQKRALRLLADSSMTKKDLSAALGIDGQAFGGVLDPLVESGQVVKIGDDYSLPEIKEVDGVA